MFELKRSNKESEFDTQALLYWRMKQLGYPVRGEVRGSGDGFKTQVRLDLAVFKSIELREVVFAIECKTTRREEWKSMYKTCPQIRAYSSLEIPVMVVCGPKEAEKFLQDVPRWLQLPAGVHWL